MIKIRIWIAATLAWLLCFYNIERFHEPINIASFVYVLAAAVAIAIVFVQSLQKIALGWIIGACLLLLIGFKLALGYAVLGPGLPITVTEACAIILTAVLARGIASSIERFEEGASEVMTMHLGEKLPQFDAGQSDIYREVRRARHYQRPLALLAISSNGKSTSVPVNRFLEEVQQSTIKKYIDARIADLLTREMKDCDIIVQRGDHFVVLLPELEQEQVQEMVDRMKTAAWKDLGIRLRAGMATFPHQEVTFTGLLGRAVEEMRCCGEQNSDTEPDVPGIDKPNDESPQRIVVNVQLDSPSDVTATTES